MSVTRESILAAAEAKPFANVMVKEWGGAVKVYGLTSDEKDAFDAETIKRHNKRRKNPAAVAPRVRVRLIIATVCSDDGTPLFTPADEDKLAAMPSGMLDLPFKAAARLSGFFGEDEADDEGN